MHKEKIVVKDLSVQITPDERVMLHSLSKRKSGVYDPSVILRLVFPQSMKNG